MKKIIYIILISLLFTACPIPDRDNPFDRKSTDYVVFVDPNRENGAMVSSHEEITFTFADPMDTGDLSLSGTANTTGAGEVWTTVTQTNDTLTISPATLWTTGAAQTIVVNCDTANGSAASLTVTYNIENAVYVSIDDPDSDDANPGTIPLPKRTVQAGIDEADTRYTTGEVRVAMGIYAIDYRSTSSPVAEMVEEISLYGGYSLDFSFKNTSLYETILDDLSTGDAGTAILDPNRAVTFDGRVSSISNSTVIEGFIIKIGNSNSNNTGIFCHTSSPTISDNVFIGEANSYATNSIWAFGIIGNTSSPEIMNNTIFETWSSGAVSIISIGIHLEGNNGSSPLVQSNTVYGGKATSQSIGIRDYGGSTISNNIIYANSGYESTASVSIYCQIQNSSISNNQIHASISQTREVGLYIRNCQPIVNANLFFRTAATGCTNQFAIYEHDATSDPNSVTNNFFHDDYSLGGDLAFYFDDEYGEADDGATSRIASLSGNIVNGTTNTLQGWGNDLLSNHPDYPNF